MSDLTSEPPSESSTDVERVKVLEVEIEKLRNERDSYKLEADEYQKQLAGKDTDLKKLHQDFEDLKKKFPNEVQLPNVSEEEEEKEAASNAASAEDRETLADLKAERDKYRSDAEEAKKIIFQLNLDLTRAQDEIDAKKQDSQNSSLQLKIGGRDVEEVIEDKNRMIKSLEDELSRLEREHEDALQRLDDSNQQNEAVEDNEETGEIPYDVLDRLDDELAGAKHELQVRMEQLKQCQESEASMRKKLDEALLWKEQALASQLDLTAARNALASKEKELVEERQTRRAIEARYDEKLKLKVRQPTDGQMSSKL